MSPAALPWAELITAIESAQRVLIIAHVNPDADALGSALALQLSLTAVGKSVAVSVGTPGFSVPRALRWLPGSDGVVAPEALGEAEDLVIAVDCAAADRLGELLARARSAPTFAVVDHHKSNEGFASVNVIDPQSPATGAMVATLIDQAGWPWVPGVAENIYAAVSSDTGSFRFPATSADTHRLIAALHDRGIDHTAIAQALFAARPLSVARLSAQVIAAARHDPEAVGQAGAIIGVVTAAQRDRLGVGYEDVESVIADLAAIGDADVAVVIKESEDHRWKVSLRSKGRLDVGRLATDLGGGGHQLASGYTAAEDEAETVVAHLTAMLTGPEYLLP